ncbi:hypothetical protein DL96DRAFT_1504322 [Flagelloscypha sp. PMI_526]|nr:hypothetical protein DL96DRAFT_1504322 [Flagelloscypha sp. PMI_526]
MFKFDFDIEEADPSEVLQSISSSSYPSDKLPETTLAYDPSTEIDLSILLDALPSQLSYSPLSIPGTNIVLARRDLFDARFQLISDSEEREALEERAMKYIDDPSDIVPAVYEGGFKTWECSLDLVQYLDIERLADRRVLEVGCGTGIPSAFLLQRHLFQEKSEPMELHLQDYNATVLKLVTFPNLFLAWYMSPHSRPIRDTHNDSAPPDEKLAEPNLGIAGELYISESLKSAFFQSLKERNVELKFFSGSWSTFIVSKPYDLVLTSETIYRLESLPDLIGLLARAAKEGALDSSLKDGIALVAAKVLYFGVGGGIADFISAVESWETHQGSVETVWEKKEGVGRKILKVLWQEETSDR